VSVSIPRDDEAHNAGVELLERAGRRGAAPLLRCDGRISSGDELVERALGAERALRTRGLAPGDRVLLLLRDTPAFHAAFLGAMRGGFVPVPISTLLPPKDVAFIARDADVRVALIDSELPPAVCEQALLPAEAQTIEVSGWDIGDDTSVDSLAPARTRGGDPAFWLYTSGTTGRPKGVIHRHLDLAATAALYAVPVLEMNEGDRVLSAAKLFFAYGLGNGLTFPLVTGAEIVLHPDRPTPESMFELIRREQPTIFFAVPTLYAAMLAHPDAPKDLERVRLCVSAGEALPAPIYDRWRDRFGVDILDGLGSTEMLHIFLSNRVGKTKAGSSGIPVPGYEVRLVDAEGADVPEGEVGALVAGGPSAALAYHGRPAESSASMFAPGWLRTGDSYRRDADGFYFHVGRTDDLMKVSGQWVSPVEIEGCLAEHDSVLEAAVVEWRDGDDLARPKAFVVLKQPANASDGLARELADHVKSQLAPHKYPRQVEFVDALPRTATGKLQRFELRKAAPEADGGGAASIP
jgi:benzoate-CoA ligase